MPTIETTFQSVFQQAPGASGFTPGRVNLIGEHTDYNGGMVLPTALTLGLSLAIRPRDDQRVRVYSDKFDTMAERTLDEVASDDWSDYALGAIIMANRQGFLSGGADIAVNTTLPFGAGLSSSAAITVGLLKLTRDLSGQTTPDKDIAVLARQIENDFIGMPCGIMDQMAVAIARPGQALALATDTLDYTVVDIPEGYHMAVIHSGQYRRLSEGRYKVRKEECDVIKAVIGRDDICQMSPSEFKKLSHLPAPIQARARHCISEHQRTVTATQAMRDTDMARFGNLMIQSHASMRDDFDITLPQIDTLVDDAVSLGALGARMTGGGFGGCIVACIAQADYATWLAQVLEKHSDAYSVC